MSVYTEDTPLNVQAADELIFAAPRRENPPWPDAERTALARAGASAHAATCLNANKLGRPWIDDRAITGGPNKLRVMRKLAFPPVADMPSKSFQARPSWLPGLYARRAVGGVIKRLNTIP